MFAHETPNSPRYSPWRTGLHHCRHPRPGSNPRKPSGRVARLSDRGAGGRSLLAAGRQVGAGVAPDHHGSHARPLSQAGNPARPAAAVAGSQVALEADGASEPYRRRYPLRRLRPLPLPLHRRRPKLAGKEAGQPCRRPEGPTGQHRRLRKQRPVHLPGPRSPGAAPYRPPGVREPVLPGGHLQIQRRRPDLASQRSPETSLQENRGRRQSHRQPGRR